MYRRERLLALFVLSWAWAGSSGCGPEADPPTGDATRAASGAGLAPRTLELVLQIEEDPDLLAAIKTRFVVRPRPLAFDPARFQEAVTAAFSNLEAELGEPGSAKERTTDFALAITGHSNGPVFWGAMGDSALLGQRPAAEEMIAWNYPVVLEEVARGFPRVAERVRAVVLLGCNAGREIYLDQWGGVAARQRQVFPKLIVAAGFNNSAPLGGPAGRFFRDALWTVRMNYRDGTPAQAARLLRVLVNQDYPYGAYKIFDAAGQGVYGAKAAVPAPQLAYDRRRTLMPQFWNYYRGRGVESDVRKRPWYPSASDGVLRDFYLAAHDYIDALASVGAVPSTMDLWYRDVGLAVRLFKEIQENWVRDHEVDLAALRQRYPLLPTSVRLGSMRRSELLAALKSLPASQTLPAPDALDRFADDLVCQLVRLDPKCLPPNYIHAPDAPH